MARAGALDGGLFSLLERWLASEADFSEAWDPAFGTRLLEAGPEDAPAVLASVGLRLSERGAPCDWQVLLRRPAAFRWGRRPIPLTRTIGILSDGQRARLRTDRGDRRFVRRGDDWRGRTIAFRRVGAFTVEPVGKARPAIIYRALRLISERVPIYKPWVDRVIRHVLLLPPAGALVSGSTPANWGFVRLSAEPEPAGVAESLIHEASHQHYHLLRLLGPLDDGSDRGLHYSPAVGRKRPLDRILVAYHAFANVLLYYRQCGGRWCKRSEPALVRMVATLEKPLRANPALTPSGRALCEPLFERLS